MKILIAADGSPYSKRMLAYLAAHDEWLGASHQYTVLTVVMGVPSRAAAVLDKATLKSYYDEEAEKVLKPIRAFFERQGIRATYLAKVGHAADVIAAQAEAGRYDLLLMGSHGHGNLANLVMGSVAARVMASCKTPLLLVR
ncbi:MAG: universal stress protein [Ideonella sp.]|nr:universal stress protein [Ideonella sp.]MBP6777768.1 universal stress protein [Piscinibacter sp.]